MWRAPTCKREKIEDGTGTILRVTGIFHHPRVEEDHVDVGIQSGKK